MSRVFTSIEVKTNHVVKSFYSYTDKNYPYFTHFFGLRKKKVFSYSKNRGGGVGDAQKVIGGNIKKEGQLKYIPNNNETVSEVFHLRYGFVCVGQIFDLLT